MVHRTSLQGSAVEAQTVSIICETCFYQWYILLNCNVTIGYTTEIFNQL